MSDDCPNLQEFEPGLGDVGSYWGCHGEGTLDGAQQ